MSIANLKKPSVLFLFPIVALITFILVKSLNFSLHDFSNSFFAAHIAKNTTNIEDIIFDIYSFNQYIWKEGYTEVFADFYINSPFNGFVFYPLTVFKNAYLAKLIFNLISCLLFLITIYKLAIKELKKDLWWITLIPLLFFVPIKNQILFGQSYFLVLSLVIFGYLMIKNNRENITSLLFSFAILIKIFPLFYIISFVFHWKPKMILKTSLICLLLILISMSILDFELWRTYVFEIIPNTIANKSAISFQYSAQSIDVFLKRVFIYDSYHNPTANFDSKEAYIIIKWVVKSFILGIAISISLQKKEDLFVLLSVWIVTLFLLQSNTATYTQIFWLIPLYHMIKQRQKHKVLTYTFVLILFIMCNFPFNIFVDAHIIFRFSRLWFMLFLGFIFYAGFSKALNYKMILVVLLILAPLQYKLFIDEKGTKSNYALDKKKYFIIYDYSLQNNHIAYNAIGINGPETELTNILVSHIDTTRCVIQNNQIYCDQKQVTFDYSLKKKPMLINNSVYYLTDLRARRGAYTLKKIVLD